MPEIRPAAAGDLDEIWAIVCRAVAQMNALGNPQWGADYPTKSHYAADLARGELYIAQGGGGAILGVACLNTDQAPEYAPLPWRIPGPAMVIHRMAVDPAAQRQGVARALFLFAEEFALRMGLRVLHVDTYAQNQRMRALISSLAYEEVGFVHFDRVNRPLPFPCFEKVLLP